MQTRLPGHEHLHQLLPDRTGHVRLHAVRGAGYELIAADVTVHYMWDECPEAVALKGMLPFEDWYVRPELVDMALANRFRSDNKLWSDIIAGVVGVPVASA